MSTGVCDCDGSRNTGPKVMEHDLRLARIPNLSHWQVLKFHPRSVRLSLFTESISYLVIFFFTIN